MQMGDISADAGGGVVMVRQDRGCGATLYQFCDVMWTSTSLHLLEVICWPRGLQDQEGVMRR